MATRSTQKKTPPDQALIDLIITNNLTAGDKLPTEEELSETLGISRNSVRETVRELRALGVLEIRHPQGTYLRQASLDGLTRGLAFWSRLADRDGLNVVQPINDVREVLEVSLISRTVDRLGATDLQEIEKIVRGMEQAAGRGDYAPDLDRNFHEAVFRPLENWVFSYLLQSFWEVYESVRHLVDRQEWSPQANAKLHRDIYTALYNRDADAATEAMIRHFDNSLRSNTASNPRKRPRR